MENEIYVGNIVSFVDTSYFIKLMMIKEDAILYKYKKGYIDISEYLDDYEEYVNHVINNENKNIISDLPVHDIFVDDKSLKPYIKNIKKLTR